MNNGWAIIIAGILVAASIVFVGRWTIVSPTVLTAYRLDRWTGDITFCVNNANGAAGAKMQCVDDWTPVKTEPAK